MDSPTDVLLKRTSVKGGHDRSYQTYGGRIFWGFELLRSDEQTVFKILAARNYVHRQEILFQFKI